MEANPVQAFQQWKDAQNTLDHAMQRYLDSLVVLQSSLYSNNNSAEYLSVRAILAQTWSNDPDKDSTLAQAQVRLNQIRNTVLSVNALPFELLLKIFQTSAFQALHTRDNPLIPFSYRPDDHKNLRILTHVCSHWRTILLNTPSFWSRFELDTKAPIMREYQRAEVYLGRSHGAPQSLYIDLQSMSHCSYFKAFGMIFKLLEPRLGTVTQLALLNFTVTQLIMETVMSWLRHGKPGVLRTLTIRMEAKTQQGESIYTGSKKFAERAAPMLSQVRFLSLRGVKFAWNCPIYHNLVLLHIGSIPPSRAPRIHEMLHILSACPLLRTLKISNMSILPSGSTSLTPVYLTKLEHLDLVRVPCQALDLLLPMIYPQSKDLHLCITSTADYDRPIPALYSFLNRTNVVQLFLQQSMIAQVPAVPNLRALIIDLELRRGDSCLSDLARSNEPNTKRAPRCPNLQVLHLLSGSVNIGPIQEIVETCPLIRKLRFSACYVEPFEDELSYWLKPYKVDIRFDLRLDEEEIFYWSQLMT